MYLKSVTFCSDVDNASENVSDSSYYYTVMLNSDNGILISDFSLKTGDTNNMDHIYSLML